MLLVRLIVAIFFAFLSITPATAQTPPPNFELGAGFLFGFPASEDCSDAGVTFDDCPGPSYGWEVEPAYFVTDRLAVVGRVSGLYSSLNTQARMTGFAPVAVDLDSNLHEFLGGVRFTGPRANRRVTPYAQMLVGTGRVAAEISAVGLSESDSATGLSLSPEGGLYLHASERFGIRIGGRYDVRRIQGSTGHGFTLVTNLIFGS